MFETTTANPWNHLGYIKPCTKNGKKNTVNNGFPTTEPTEHSWSSGMSSAYEFHPGRIIHSAGTFWSGPRFLPSMSWIELDAIHLREGWIGGRESFNFHGLILPILVVQSPPQIQKQLVWYWHCLTAKPIVLKKPLRCRRMGTLISQHG